jgi:polyphosphate glucokinase
MTVLGIDIGGTGIKGAPVNVETGTLLTEHFRVLTPHPATPDAVAGCVEEVVKHFEWTGEIGCTLPSVVKNGIVMTAANIDPSWIGTNAVTLFEAKTHCKTTVINDADAAGLAEMKFGAGRDNKGLVFMCTLGTGIGSALFIHGLLVPNTELGHIEVGGKDAELRAAERIRLEKDLTWKGYAKRVNRYLLNIEKLLWPDLIIIGGGASKNASRFIPHLTVHAQVVPAQLLNDAGIAGAALATLRHEAQRESH